MHSLYICLKAKIYFWYEKEKPLHNMQWLKIEDKLDHSYQQHFKFQVIILCMIIHAMKNFQWEQSWLKYQQTAIER